AALEQTSVHFLAVGTPTDDGGGADLSQIWAAAENIGRFMNKDCVVVTKSTVPVGTTCAVGLKITEQLKARGVNFEFSMVSNPEFLKEGTLIADFMRPDRIIVGTDNPKSLEIMRELYAPFTTRQDRLIHMDIKSAEMTKYAANSMLATKISFINEIANICELVGADVNLVRRGIGSDPRIGPSFIYPGCGYGGSCFPKDIKALMATATSLGYSPKLIEAVEAVNEAQKLVLVKKVLARFGENLKGKQFGIWGLAFKPGTDDMREAPSINIIKSLSAHGATLKVYDPYAENVAKNIYLKNVPNVEYCQGKYEALAQAHALILITEWKEFRSCDFDEIKKQMHTPIIFDGRNQYDKHKLRSLGFEYHAIGI
ncbi:MAG: UDP-glucose dehydrogenase family protein, partial [Candidatus Adiutrix sp.]